MKKILLLIALVASPVFAQEEEQEVEIQIETGGGVEVATGSDTKAQVATLVRRFRDDGSENEALDESNSPPEISSVNRRGQKVSNIA